MKTSKKQIFIVYKHDVFNNMKPIIVTTSIQRLQKYIIDKLKDDDFVLYADGMSDKKIQIKQFKSDFKILTRDKINRNLFGLKYDYVYDGEEF